MWLPKQIKCPKCDVIFAPWKVIQGICLIVSSLSHFLSCCLLLPLLFCAPVLASSLFSDMRGHSAYPCWVSGGFQPSSPIVHLIWDEKPAIRWEGLNWQNDFIERDLEKLLLRRNKVAGKFVVVSCGILCRLFSLLQLFFDKMWWALELFSRDLFTFYIFKRKQVENVWLSWFILCLARHFIYPFSFYWHNNVTHWLLLMRYPMLHGLGIVQTSDPSHCHPKDMGTC